MPPYLGETQESAAAFLRQVDLARYPDLFQLEEILPAIDAIAPANTAAKAAIDIALHDWVGRKLNAPLHRLWGLNPAKTPVTSFTISAPRRTACAFMGRGWRCTSKAFRA